MVHEVKLSEAFAKEVRNMKAEFNVWIGGVDLARKYLKFNNFDLEKA